MKNRTAWALCLVMIALTIPTTVNAQNTQEKLSQDLIEIDRQRTLATADRDAAEAQDSLGGLIPEQQLAAERLKLQPDIQREAADVRAFMDGQDNLNHLLQGSTRWQDRNLATARGFFANRTDPRLAEAYNKANSQLAELVQKIKTAESEEVKLELKAEVKLLLEEKYDAYLEHHEAPLIELEERLAKLREDFDSRQKAKDDLVKLRLDTIWYDAIGLGWPENQRGANPFGINLNNRTFGVPDSRSPFMLNVEAGNVPNTLHGIYETENPDGTIRRTPVQVEAPKTDAPANRDR